MWPMAMARKKPPIMTSVHIARVTKVCFFFSYSDALVSWNYRLISHRLLVQHEEPVHTSLAISVPVPGWFSEAGSPEPPSLMSEKDDLLPPSTPEASPFLWLNLMFLRGFAIVSSRSALAGAC